MFNKGLQLYRFTMQDPAKREKLLASQMKMLPWVLGMAVLASILLVAGSVVADVVDHKPLPNVGVFVFITVLNWLQVYRIGSQIELLSIVDMLQSKEAMAEAK